MITRRKTTQIKVGQFTIGSDNPIRVQSMTKTPTENISITVRQIKKLESAGCEIIRVAVPDKNSAKVLGKIKEKISIPLVADIHFDPELALIAIEQGIDKLRLNPGNIKNKLKIKEIAKKALKNNIPIRIGVNSGSVPRELLDKYDNNIAKALVEAALWEIELLEKEDFDKIIISLKSSNVITTIDAYKMLAKKCSYPFHIGITEAGTMFQGLIKSSSGIGILLYEGFGDTLRVSLTENPVNEVNAGFKILEALNIRKRGFEIISCPTCARCGGNVKYISKIIEKQFLNEPKKLKVAVMGCVVNGPGEAKDADIGIAFGKNDAVLFSDGKLRRKISENAVLKEFIKEIKIKLRNRS